MQKSGYRVLLLPPYGSSPTPLFDNIRGEVRLSAVIPEISSFPSCMFTSLK